MSLDGGGASEGRETGISFGGAAADAREYRKAIDSCFLSRRGWMFASIGVAGARHVTTHLVK